jgi:hypothetical protein
LISETRDTFNEWKHIFSLNASTSSLFKLSKKTIEHRIRVSVLITHQAKGLLYKLPCLLFIKGIWISLSILTPDIVHLLNYHVVNTGPHWLLLRFSISTVFSWLGSIRRITRRNKLVFPILVSFFRIVLPWQIFIILRKIWRFWCFGKVRIRFISWA